MNKNEFFDEKKEYIIRDMFPIRPWLNYAWNEEYVSSFDQFGFGISRYNDEKGFKKNILTENDNRLIFIKDKESGEYYAANRNYDEKPFDIFETHVGQGYSVIRSEYRGISTSLKLFVPLSGLLECWELKIENKYSTERELSVYSYAGIDTSLSPMDGYSKAAFSEKINGIVGSHSGYELATDVCYMYFSSSEKPTAYETSNRRFKGVYSDIGHPVGIKDTDKLSNKETCFEMKIGAAMQFDFVLPQNGTKKIYFVLGAAKSEDEAERICKKYLFEKAFDDEFSCLKEKIDKFQSNIIIDTPDEDINRRTNIWLKRQIELGKQWGRLYGKGFRDVMQDTMGFLPLDTKNARERILYAVQYQREDGNPLRQWEPIMHEKYADGAAWLIYAVNAYLKETGDFSILDEEVKYFESDVKETILEHCFRGIDYLQNNLGEHGLCLWLGGDWNDSINACGLLGKGESVWLSEATVKAANEFVEILSAIGKLERIPEIKEKAHKMTDAILEYGFDFDHFIYGINDYGEKIGAYESPEGKIFLNPQTWAVLSDIVTDDEAIRLMNFVEDNLGCPYGYIQNTPSYTTPDQKIGRLSYFGRGLFENGSVYNHGVAFKAVADCMTLGGQKALETIKRILPTNPCNEKSGVEPYAMSNMYFGPDNESRSGDAPQSWITGTSGWLLRCITENIIGIKADFSGLRIEPSLPDDWKTVTVKRMFRGAEYNITLKKTEGDTILMVDGDLVPYGVIKPFESGVHNIILTGNF